LAGLDRNRLVRGADLGLQLGCGTGRRMSVPVLRAARLIRIGQNS
jgi:hypothetical protein